MKLTKVNRIKHDNVIKWRNVLRYGPFVRGIHWSPVSSPHKGQWRGALMFSLIYAWISGWVNNRDAGDLRRHRAHYDVIIMDRSDKRKLHIDKRPSPIYFKVISRCQMMTDLYIPIEDIFKCEATKPWNLHLLFPYRYLYVCKTILINFTDRSAINATFPNCESSLYASN